MISELAPLDQDALYASLLYAKTNKGVEYFGRKSNFMTHIKYWYWILTIARRGRRATMIAANIPHKTCYKVFIEAFTRAIDLDGLQLLS